MKKNIHLLRNDYKSGALNEQDAARHPVEQFEKWFTQAMHSGIKEPTAVILATSTKSGIPSARAVLMKDFSRKGFVFFTNYQSRKGRELNENPRAALLFYWDILERQVRIEGTVQKVGAAMSDQYFSSRPRQSRLGALISPQSEVVESRDCLEKRMAEAERKYAGNKKIPRPHHWGGYLVKPHYFEFWQGRESRLHDRLVYVLLNRRWHMKRLAP